MRGLLGYEKVRFILVGIFNTCLDFLLLNILTFMGDLNVLVANSTSVFIGITVSYFLNHVFVFRSKEPLSFRKYLTFFAVTGVSSLVIQNLIIYGASVVTESSLNHSLFIVRQLAEHRQIELNVAKALAVGVGMVWNFLLYKYVVFKVSAKEPAIEVEKEIYE